MFFQHLFVMMGIGCNFKCRYCMQHPLLTQPVCGPRVSPELLSYLQNLPPFDPEHPENKYTVTLYGGEPLLYWDTIKQMVEALGSTGRFHLGMVSNGSLLTDDKVDYMNQHRMGFTVSNDGPRTAEFRGRNVLEEPEILERLQRLVIPFTIEAVYTAGSYDLAESLAYWKDKGVDSDRVQLGLIMDTGNLPSDLVNFNLDALQTVADGMEERLYQSLTTNTPTPEMGIANGYIWRMRSVTEDEDLLKEPKCGCGYHTLNMDLQGNCYLCHNSPIKIGTIQDSYETLVEAYKTYDPYTTSEECQSCPVVTLCGGGCLLMSPEARKNKYCPMARIYYGATLNAVLRAGKTFAENQRTAEDQIAT